MTQNHLKYNYTMIMSSKDTNMKYNSLIIVHVRVHQTIMMIVKCMLL